MNKLGIVIVPSIIFVIIVFGYVRKVSVFDEFVNGARDGMKSLIALVPTLVGLIVSVSMLKSSGAIDILSSFLKSFCNLIHIPNEIIPLVILKPISGSGSIAILDNIFKNYGVDSIIGKISSVIMGSTETAFYAITVYFGATSVKNIRHTVACAIIADIIGVFVAVWIVNLLFT